MPPKAKKGAGGGGAGAKAAAGPKAGPSAKSAAAGGGSKDERWAQAQIAALVGQREAAEGRGDAWVSEPHEWYEERLSELLELLRSGMVQSVPDEVREGIQDYVAQLADGAEVAREAFYDDREVFGDLLKASTPEPLAPYVRPAETPEAEEAAEALRAWGDATQQGMDKFVRLLRQHPESAAAAEAALSRIASLAADHKDDMGSSAASGLAPKPMLEIVADAMHKFPRDTRVQVQGCAAVLSLVRHTGSKGMFTVLEAGGAKLWVDALRNNIADAEVALIATRAFSYMVGPKGVTEHTPEWAFLCASGAEQVLTDVLPYHLNDPRIDKAARTSIPFFRG